MIKRRQREGSTDRGTESTAKDFMSNHQVLPIEAYLSFRLI